MTNPSGYSFTTAFLQKTIDKLGAWARVPVNARQIQNLTTAQRVEEAKLLANKNGATCDAAVLSNIHEKLSHVDAEQLRTRIVTDFYDPGVMSGASCIIESVTYLTPADKAALNLSQEVRHHMTNLKQIGAESVMGYALQADFGAAENAFIIKVGRDATNDDLGHERIVGVLGTDKLRNTTAVFSYILGGFKCSPPIIDPETKRVLAWCLSDTKNVVNYVVYENIVPAIPAYDYFHRCTGQQYLVIFMQLLYGLMASAGIEFTHYDLHDSNVLLRKPQAGALEFLVQILTERGIEYIKTVYVPIIIDYGFSHIAVKNGTSTQHFGGVAVIKHSVYPDRRHIFHDVYKFFMFSMHNALQHGNTSMLAEGAKIFKYFNVVEDFETCISTQRPLYYSFPLTTDTKKLTLEDFTAYIRTVCDCDFIYTDPGTMRVLDCGTFCTTPTGLYNDVGINGDIKVPTNIIDFYDVDQSLQRNGRQEARQTMYDAFYVNYAEVMDTHIKKLSTYITDITARLQYIYPLSPDLSTFTTVEEVYNLDTLSKIKQMYLQDASISSDVADAQLYVDTGRYMAKLYNDNTTIENIKTLEAYFTENTMPLFKQFLTLLNANDKYLDAIAVDPRYKPEVDRLVAADTTESLMWYATVRPAYNVALLRK